MSQESQVDKCLLDNIAEWSQQECLENLDTVLPMSLLSALEESTYISEGIRVLKLVCELLLPCVPAEQCEDRLFAQLCKAACGLVESALNKIYLNVRGELKGATEEVKAVVGECLQWLLDIGQCIEACVRYVLSNAGSPELSCILSLPSCAVHVLHKIYSHCKESSELYGGLLEDVSEPLSNMFKQAHSLQMALLSLLDSLRVSGPPLEENVQALCTVCVGLFDVCRVVSTLDVKLVVSLWKAISRVCNRHLSLLRDRLDVCPFVSFLCEEIEGGYQHMFQLCPSSDPNSLTLGDDKAFSKCVRILGFQMKVLVALLRDFADFLGQCEGSVLKMLLFIHRLLPPSLGCRPIQKKQEAELRGQILSATGPVIGHLMGSRVFRTGMTTPQERTPEDHLPLLLLQLMVLDGLPRCEVDVMDHWLAPVNHSSDTPTKGLLDAIFQTIRLCGVEMRVPVMLPGVMVAGKAQRQVSLYEHVASHLCGYTGACLAKHFRNLERTLLTNVLDDDILTATLAIDCWCFLARFGTAAVCDSHVRALTSVYEQLVGRKSHSSQVLATRLLRLLWRLTKFMSPDHQAALVQTFPPETHPDLWVSLTLKPLSPDVCQTISQKLSLWGLDVLQASSGKFSSVTQALAVLTELVSGPDPSLSPYQHTVLLNVLVNMWTQIEFSTEISGVIREKLLAQLLPLTRCFLQKMGTEDLLQVLTVVQACLKGSSSHSLCGVVARFLSGCAHLKLTPSIQKNQVLERLAALFHQLLSHPHPLVHHVAMTSFSEFASHTVHEEVIPLCIQGSGTIQAAVEHFLNKVPFQAKQVEFDLLEHLRRQRLNLVKEEYGASCVAGAMTHGEVAQRVTDGMDSGIKETEMERGNTKEKISFQENEHESSPKRAKLSPPCEGDVTLATTTEAGGNTSSATLPQTPCVASTTKLESGSTGQQLSSKLDMILDRLKAVVTEIEQECAHSSPLPHCFTAAAKEAAGKIVQAVCTSDWFDTLS